MKSTHSSRTRHRSNFYLASLALVSSSALLSACSNQAQPNTMQPGKEAGQANGVYGAEQITADTVERDFPSNTDPVNIFQDQFGVQQSGVEASDGYDAGKCDVNLTDGSAGATQRAIKKDHTDIDVAGDNVFTVTVTNAVIDKPGFLGMFQHSSCHLLIARYGNDQKFQAGTFRQQIIAKTYAGNLASGKRTALFDNDLYITPGNDLASRAADTCRYVAETNGAVYESPADSKINYVLSDKGALYKIDASGTPQGLEDFTSCHLKVSRIDIVRPFQPQNAVPKIIDVQPSDKEVEVTPPNGSIDQGQIPIVEEREETVELQSPTIVNLDSDLVYPQTYSAGLGLEFGSREGQTVGVNGGLNFQAFTVGASTSQEQQIYAAIKPNLQTSAGVNLDGAKCRHWETSIYGRQIYAVANDHAAGIDNLRFRYFNRIEYHARNLCTAAPR